MKYLSCVLLALFIITTLTSCSKDDGDGCTSFNSNDLVLTIQDEFTTLPGKVSVFFKVDTRNGEPVAGLTTENFSVYEKGRNDECYNSISIFEANARISPNSQVYGSNTMLVLDFSGSVINSSLVELKQSAISFIENIMPEEPNEAFKMGIFWFDGADSLHQLAGFLSDRDELVDKINGLSQSQSSDPSTDLYGAVIKSTAIATEVLNDLLSEEIIASTSIVLFTDGTDQAARYSREEAIMTVHDAQENISFFTIGLGNEIDEDVLRSIGKTSSIIVENKEDLESTFIETSTLVFEEANSYYLFEYCSPKRDGSGVSELAIQANRDGQRGAALTSFNATGFTSGCQ